jgi:hypothetical protein
LLVDELWRKWEKGILTCFAQRLLWIVFVWVLDEFDFVCNSNPWKLIMFLKMWAFLFSLESSFSKSSDYADVCIASSFWFCVSGAAQLKQADSLLFLVLICAKLKQANEIEHERN